MKCQKCSNDFHQRELQEHHIYPQYLGGLREDGILILCKKCHVEIQNLIEAHSLHTKDSINEFTQQWLRNNKTKKVRDVLPFCPNNCMNFNQPNRMFIHQVGKDTVVLMCSICGYKKESSDYLNYWMSKEIQSTIKSIQESWSRSN